MVVVGALAPLVVAAFAVVALVAAGGQAVAIIAVSVIAGALTLSILAAGTQRVDALSDRFHRATKLANEVAAVRLPEALEAAREGRVGTDERHPLVPDERDELGDLLFALDRTQRTAITLAAEQARVKRQASDMFVDLGRRHQALLGRTLALVADLESSQRDPATVTDLLRLDHLVTRMRRNAESLLVLAGTEPGRGWADACAVEDVVRNALGEIEAFDRIDIAVLEPDRVVGRAVGAVGHLLAELLENATVFSPPDSRVTVNGVHRPDGYVLSIVDTGIGLKPDELQDANQRLTQFHTVEFTPPRRLGLAVVAELARRHGIVVQLQPTPGGGTTASVLLSPALLAGAANGAAAGASYGTTVAPPAATPAPAPVAGGGPGEGSDLLPRRVPGEQIPQLAPAREDDDVPARDAPAVATQLSGFQHGVERARAGTDARTDAGDDAPATAATAPEATETTASGLERRVAGAQLPDTGPGRDPSATAPARNPDEVRSALTSFQHGVARGTLDRLDPMNGEEPS
jgi:signal transduction histidine kinase